MHIIFTFFMTPQLTIVGTTSDPHASVCDCTTKVTIMIQFSKVLRTHL